MPSELLLLTGLIYENNQIGGTDRRRRIVPTLAVNMPTPLKPVANYIPRPTLQQQIRDQLHSVTDHDNDESRIVILGQNYGVVFWVEAGQKETIERDYIQIFKQLFPKLARSSRSSINPEEAVPAVKSWFKQQHRRSLLVVDSADAVDDEDDPSYIHLHHYLPDAPKVDIIITTRSSQA
ncbi:uncharacterized protein A1O9_08641 [Exophiala aquamarina CBS 119918]|uniref:NB-ARC domain-containing protein n=1 Tax=Exophiala aquamarina CBS 119918 TaxID=1182545 RepID=A0A072P4G1_9EURO|nr:uncharacterized protein A1O9_08641 [Exophiala aquamarina CBS 119918]KEF54989.1 hypothetical protein A1O9_08641 [Exophiala aquamarina CBS 119918]